MHKILYLLRLILLLTGNGGQGRGTEADRMKKMLANISLQAD